ncbi:MAG: D-alanyl-D-alanine carboxypeptidase [Firmicutes bacterium]|nr:D-alanyl-D-alanine carboxypeptidase [Bacillota bacterium]
MSQTSRPAKRFHHVLLLLLSVLLMCLQTASVFAADDPPETQCKSVYLYDQTTGEVLYEKKADEPRTPASTTKIMTAALVLENVDDLDAEVKIPGDAVFWVGSHMGLLEGEVLTVRQLLEALMVCSANDAARALAIYVAGSQKKFVKMMNDKAKAIGAVHTHYLNPNGFTESWDHVTTARDMGLIVDYAFTVDGFAELVSTKRITIPATNKSDKRIYRNTNLLLWDDQTTLYVNGKARVPKYEGAFGVKTGMMGRAGYCLVAGAERDGTRLIAVCLRGEDENYRFEDSIALFDWAFENYETRQVIEPGTSFGTVHVEGAEQPEAEAYCEDGLLMTVDKKNEESGSYETVLYQTVSAPLSKGDQVGYIRYTKTNGESARLPLTVRDAVPEGGFWTKYFETKQEFHTVVSMAAACAVVVLLLLVVLICRHAKKKKGKRNA